MAPRSTSGAVHLTSLDLDISGIQQSIQAIESEMAELEKSILSNANNIQESLSKINPELSTSGSRDFENSMKVNRASVEDLNLAYKEFLTTLSDSKVSKDILGDLPEDAKKSADEVSKLTEEVRESGTVTKEAANQYEELSSALKDQKGRLADATTEFNNLPPVIEKATSAADRFVTRLLDLGKNEVIYAFSSGMQRAFSQIIPTITETENAVIELQRVLNDTPERSALADELYDIAYTYGQTFDVVQETAVKFAQTGLSWTEVIDATRATMLGLNTAELEVSSATQGLISVLTQFNMSASELETVIDKVNITADNFPITSEKIVAALQRAGGTASAFGLTLEQTIGVITALGAATGRTGEAIGTALNSLISFSMKASSLSTFEDFLGLSSGSLQGQNVVAIWKALADEIKNTGDSGAELAKTLSSSDEFMDLFNEDTAKALGLMEEFKQAEQELNADLAAGQDIYSTVGTYRQNYFIALLNNIDMAVDAMEGMNEAAGYSAQENETAMEALSKKYQQLVVSLQELAVALGEAGFLDFLKLLADISTSIVQFIDDANMLVPVLELVVTAFLAIKAQSIADTVVNVGTAFKNAGSFIKGSIASITGYTAATEGAAVATTSLSAALGGVVGIIGLVVTAVTAGVQAYKNYKQAQKEALEEAVELGKEATESFNDLAEAYNEYKKALDYGDTEGAAAAQADFLAQLGYTIDDMDVLTARYAEQGDVIQVLLEKEYELAQIRAENAYMAAQNTSTINMVDYDKSAGGIEDDAYWALVDALGSADEAGIDFLDTLREIPESASEVDEYLEIIDAALEVLKSQFTGSELASMGLYQAFVQQKEELLAWSVELEKATADHNRFSGSAEDAAKATAENAQIIADLRTETDKFGHSVLDAADAIEDLDDITLDDLVEAMANGVMTADEFNAALQNIDVTSNDLYGAFENLQKNIKNAQEVMDKFNSKESLSIEDWGVLYRAVAATGVQIERTSDGMLQFVEDSKTGVADAADVLITRMLATMLQGEDLIAALMTIGFSADNAATLAEQYGQASEEADPKVDGLADATDSLSDAENDATTEGNKAGKAVVDLGAKVAAQKGKVNDLTASVTYLVAALGQLRTAASNALTEVGSGVSQMGAIIATQGKVNAGSEIVTLQDAGGTFMVEQPTVNATNQSWDIWFGSGVSNKGTSSTKKPSGSSSSSKGSAVSEIDDITDALDEMKDTLEDILDIYEHTIMLMTRQGATADEIVAVYRQAQQEAHDLANQYRAMGVEETSEYIRDLQKIWLDYEDAIEEIYDGIYERQVETYENALSVMEGLYEYNERFNNYDILGENIDQQAEYYQKLMALEHQRAEELREERAALIYKGADEASEVIQNIDNEIKEKQKNYLDYQQKYFDLMEKKATNALKPFEDFIGLADSLNLWNYLDFTKVDYLRQELEEINRLLEEGLISQAKYNELLKDITVDIYSAQKALMEKEKDSTQDYYDSIIDGYESEIDVWKQRREEVEDYYDDLIANLREVQEQNSRINQQIEYYNSRQKIITNLEQARARSGVAWREKEMEYQQQLINLDADWNKTQKEWDIEDQISKLEELKAAAVADIDATIEKINQSITDAEKAAKDAIARIDDELDIFAKTMAEAISKGMEDGLIDAEEEYDKALEDASKSLLEFIDEFKKALGIGAIDASNLVNDEVYQYLIVPMKNRITDISEFLRTSVDKYSDKAANDAMRNFRGSLIMPLRSELSSLASMAQNIQTLVSVSRAVPKYTTTASKTISTPGAGATVNITNYNSSTNEAASKTQSVIQKLLG